MHLSSRSERFFARDIPECVGWRISMDLSPYTHVRLVRLHLEPYSAKFKAKTCRIYCNLITKTITDPMGTLATIGGLHFKTTEPGMTIV